MSKRLFTSVLPSNHVLDGLPYFLRFARRGRFSAFASSAKAACLAVIAGTSLKAANSTRVGKGAPDSRVGLSNGGNPCGAGERRLPPLPRLPQARRASA